MDYEFLFPVIFHGGRFRVGAMLSQSYGPEYGDPLPNMVLVEEGKADHTDIALWLIGRGLHPDIRLIGTREHGSVNNKPTTLAIFFQSMDDRTEFATAFGLEP
jgi:hypothetical protein